MTDNAKKVFYFLKENHDIDTLTVQEIAAKLDLTVPAVTGSVNGLVRKKMAVRTENAITGEDGKVSTVKYIALTDEGMAFDPEQAEAEEKARKEAEKAAKAAAKAAAAE